MQIFSLLALLITMVLGMLWVTHSATTSLGSKSERADSVINVAPVQNIEDTHSVLDSAHNAKNLIESRNAATQLSE